MKSSRLLLAAAPFAVALGASPVSATVSITGIALDAPGGRWGYVTPSPNGPGTTTAVGVGRIRLTGTDDLTGLPVSIATFCVDILHWLHTGTFTAAPAATLGIDLTTTRRLNALFTHAVPLITSQDQSAAAQLAIWEVMFETGPSYDVGSGGFKIEDGDVGGAIGIANGWLANITDGTWKPSSFTGLTVLTAPGNQTQMFGINSPSSLGPVPEPATWATMMLGFGLVGAAMRRRRRTVLARVAA